MNATQENVNVLLPTIAISQGAETINQTGMNPETSELVRRCLGNDRAAQGQLYRKYYGKMMATCMRFLADRDDALEVLNTGFLKVFQNLNKFDGIGSFEGWIYRIIRNSVVDHLRSKIRYREMEGGSTEELEVAVKESALDQLYAKDLLQMLNHLPDTTRLVFNLFALEGYKHEEIAKILGISDGTSKWHVSEARRVLKIQIEKLTGNQ